MEFDPESGLPADLGRSSHTFFEATESKDHNKPILHSAEMSANNEGIANERSAGGNNRPRRP